MSLERLRDQQTPFGARAARHLREDVVVWMTTVSPGGAPAPNPVWFLWDGDSSALMYSRADAARLSNLVANPRVTLNFDGDGAGGDIVVLSGRAIVADDAEPADANPGFLAKYDTNIAGLGMTPAQFAGEYSVPVRILLTHLRGY